MEILVSGKLHNKAIKLLDAVHDATLVYRPDCQRQELQTLVSSCHVLITRSETSIDRALIDKAPYLKIIGRAAVGVANIDLEYATERGILVINCPAKNTNSAAELTFALLMCIARHVHKAYDNIRTGKWDRHKFKGWELRGKKIGIVGMGNVGHRVCKFAHGFDMQVYGYDPYLSEERFARYGVKKTDSILGLAEVCDILSLHVPLNKETTGMVDRAVLQALGKQGVLLNVARGKVVQQDDLLQALEKEEIQAVGIDTWHNEPKPDPALYQHVRVFGTPHIGASTEEAQHAIGVTIATQIKKAIAGDVVDYPVNIPNQKVIDSPLHRTFVVLAEKLGDLAGQIISFNPSTIKFRYSEGMEGDSLLKLSWLKSFLHHATNEYISIVNCQRYVDKLGIRIVEEFSFIGKAEIEVIIADTHEHTLAIGGVVYDENTARISHIEGFKMEVKPKGRYLLIKNRDVPGVVGSLGCLLAEENINIASIFLARKREEGIAMAVIEIDTALHAQGMRKLLNTSGIITTHQVEL